MALKPRYSDAQVEKLNERTDKQIGRIYLIWLAGIVVGAIQLKPERVTYSGISYAIDNPEKLQGVIFVGCVVYYLAVLGAAIMHQLQYTTSSGLAIKRHMIYSSASRGKRTLLGLGFAGVRTVVFGARLQLFIAVILFLLIACFPLIHILIFEQRAFLIGVDSIFHTASFNDAGSININATAPLLIVGAFMALWAALIQLTLKRLFERGFYGWLYKNFFLLTTFAFVESRFRGEDFLTAFLRDGPLQFWIAVIMALPIIIASPFWVWLMGYSLLARFVQWRQTKQQKRKGSGPWGNTQ